VINLDEYFTARLSDELRERGERVVRTATHVNLQRCNVTRHVTVHHVTTYVYSPRVMLGQRILASLRGRLIEYQLRLG